MDLFLFRKNKGFTLVELMVVVGIIGVLTSVAVPNFKKFQAKSKTSEAKLQLAGIYSAELTLQSDYDSFATCLLDAGFTEPQNNYYSVGFDTENASANADVTSNGGTCTTGQFSFAANKKTGGTSTLKSDLDQVTVSGTAASGTLTSPAVSNDGVNFVAGAIGYIDSGHASNKSEASMWSINDSKVLSERNRGY